MLLISYGSYQTNRDGGLYDTNDRTFTNTSFGPYSQTQISSGETSSVSNNIHPGTSYQLQFELNDSNNSYGAFSSVVTTGKQNYLVL